MQPSRAGLGVRTAFILSVIGGALALSACSQSDNNAADAACRGTPCGHFDIAKAKESSPVFLGGGAVPSPYRICVREGSVILQTVAAEGGAQAIEEAQSIGGEIRAGNCTDVSFADRVYIIGNTGSGRATGFYYRVP
jgi:hypothetical protein